MARKGDWSGQHPVCRTSARGRGYGDAVLGEPLRVVAQSDRVRVGVAARLPPLMANWLSDLSAHPNSRTSWLSLR